MKSVMMAMAVAAALFAGECTYSVKDVGVTWEAYKTPMKLGVGGTFDAIKLQARPGKSIDDLLDGAHVVIDTKSVDSKNPGRDGKLVRAFFNVQGVKAIDAVVKRVGENTVDVDVTMNGVTKTVPMALKKEGSKVYAEGYVDLGDFEMLPSLQSITRACYKLHKGKTWQDVKIAFEIETKERCR